MAIGKPLPMVDSHKRVTGQIEYVLNLKLPGMLHAKALRSQVPHGRLVRVDASKALESPGVVAVLTGGDLGPDSGFKPAFGFGPMWDRTPVAIDRVRFVGEPIAVVAAETAEIADEATRVIEVEIEELPAVFDPEAAMQPGAPIIHPDGGRWVEAAGAAGFNYQPERNVVSAFTFAEGDVEAGFAESDYVLEDVFTCPTAQQCSFEPHVVVAQTEGRERVTVWTSSQAPWYARMRTASVFGIPDDQVRVIVPTLGGGYGGKLMVQYEPTVALLAWKAGRPVRLAMTREEEFYTVVRHAVKIRIKSGFQRDGTLVARHVTLHWNAGATSDVSPNVGRNAGGAAMGPYRAQHVRSDSYAVYTNTTPAGAFRGLGIPQVAWAHEQHMDRAARELGIDRVAIRLKNMIVDGDHHATGEVLHDVHFKELLQDSIAGLDWRGPLPVDPSGVKRYGRGCAVSWKVTSSPSTSDARVTYDAEGTCHVYTSSVEMGQGSTTALAQIAAESLGVPFESIQMVSTDTDVTPFDLISASSRATHCVGTAIMRAAKVARANLFERVAEQLEVHPDDLDIRDGRVFVRGNEALGVAFGPALREREVERVEGEARYTTAGGVDRHTGKGIISAHWHQGAGAAVVEVDTETGQVSVLDYYGTSYAGKVVNPRLAQLQNDANIIFAMGQTFFEEVVWDNGRVANPNLSDYMIPSFLDVPHNFGSHSIEGGEGAEIHGIGESTMPAVAAAIGNAIYDALGVQVRDLPLTPERVLDAVDAATGEGR